MNVGNKSKVFLEFVLSRARRIGFGAKWAWDRTGPRLFPSPEIDEIKASDKKDVASAKKRTKKTVSFSPSSSYLSWVTSGNDFLKCDKYRDYENCVYFTFNDPYDALTKWTLK